MRSYLSLVSLEAKVHPKQNRLTVFCIALAVFLVTGLFSMADMAVRMENQRLREIHGYWHITVHDVSEDTIELMKKEPCVSVISRYDIANYNLEKNYLIQNTNVAIATADEDFQNIMNLGILEGTFPQNKSEILLTRHVKEQLNYQLGDRVVLETPDTKMEYTIVG